MSITHYKGKKKPCGDDIDYILVPYSKNQQQVTCHNGVQGQYNGKQKQYNGKQRQPNGKQKQYNGKQGQHNGKQKQYNGNKHNGDSDSPFMPGMKPIWNRLTNGNKSEHQNFISCCGTQFSRVINDRSHIVVASVGKKKRIFGWDTKLFVLVVTGEFKTFYEFSNSNEPYEHYNIDSKFKVFSKDIECAKGHYCCLTVGKKQNTIRFESERERNKWKYILSNSS